MGGRSHDQDLGDILLGARLIDETALAQARRECQRISRPLWRLVTRDNLVSEDALFKALRQEVRVPVLAADQLKSVDVPADLRASLPSDVAQHLGILPLERSTDGRRAVLAMVDPTSDITPIWPALTKLGVVEVRRFLVHVGTLRLGLEFFYGQPWQPEPDDPEGQAAALRSVQASLARSAITQPIPMPPGAAGSVMVDEDLRDEIADLDEPTDPNIKRPGSQGGSLHSDPPPPPVSRSAVTPRRHGASSQSLRPVPEASSGQSLRSVAAASYPGLSPVSAPLTSHRGSSPVAAPHSPTAPYRGRREGSVPELPTNELMMMVDERPLHKDSGPRAPEGDAAAESFIKINESLAQAYEQELSTRRPESMARLAQAIGERLNFAPRAVRELMLVARLFGLLRKSLLRNGPLPRPARGVLGFEVQHPLQTALRELQAVLVDFIRLPTEPDVLPLGARIVDAVTTALELADEGFSADDVGAKLRLRGCDSAIVSALIQGMESDLPALGIEPTRPDPPPRAPSAVSHPGIAQASGPTRVVTKQAWVLMVPRAPVMPEVRWRTTVVPTLSDEGLEPYTPSNAPRG